MEENPWERNRQLERENAKLKLELALDVLVRKGFPPLGPYNLGKSQSSSKTPQSPHLSGQSVTWEPFAHFGILREYTLEKLINSKSILWQQAQEKGGNLGGWNGESMIQQFVHGAFDDVVRLARLLEELTLYKEVYFVSQFRPDIGIIRNHAGTVVGVCEVKKPSRRSGSNRSDLEDEDLLRQITNYMLELRYSHGLTFVFGIITTYEEWRILWFDDTDPAARADNLEQMNALTAAAAKTPAPHDVEKGFYTRVFKHTEPALVEALVTLSHKMYLAPTHPPSSFLVSGRKFASVTATRFTWELLPKEHFRLSYEMPSNRFDGPFFLLRSYHGGGDGRVWLAASTKGKLAVIKYSVDGDNDSLNAEAARWREIWDVPDVRVITVMGRPALVIPFAFHVRRDPGSGTPTFMPAHEWTGSMRNLTNVAAILDNREISDNTNFDEEPFQTYINNPLEAARVALDHMAEKGWEHDDVEWRHVALLPKQQPHTGRWTVTPIMID
ncbi:hypothetical protein HK102_006711 [Quaeritorhiza haematococci]|nr:hypothetical protein HK102_006711 [Quaeritorhiza haematococci]